jgi:hypothetical protein
MGAAPIATIELPAVIFAPTSITCVAALRRRAKNGLGLGLTTVTLVEPLQVPPRYKRRARPGPFLWWRAIKGAKPKQPYAIGMKSCEPFALAAVWENWRRPGTEEWLRTFAVITCPANDLMAQIHDRMPVIVPGEGYDRWLATSSPIHAICSCRSPPSL